jgi:hypothetical protein
MSRRRVDSEPVLPPVSMRARPQRRSSRDSRRRSCRLTCCKEAPRRLRTASQHCQRPRDADPGHSALVLRDIGTGVSATSYLPRLEVRVVRIVASPRPVRGAGVTSSNLG